MLDSLCIEVPRALLAFGIALLLVLTIGPSVLALLATSCRETIRQDSPRLAAIMASKCATPTMGGILILAGFLVATCVLADTAQPTVWVAVILAIGLGALGVADDLCKRRAKRRGLSAFVKLTVQLMLTAPLVAWLAAQGTISAEGISLIAGVLLIVGMSNAVNLTDGLDGLAGGCSLIVLIVATLASMAPECEVLVAGLAGAVLGFLWFNRQPARVFMGDTGSLPLGGLLGLFVLINEHKLPWLLACGVFLIEAASVVLQVGWFKCTGRRVFLCAPLHHHFQFLGWTEQRIVRRFWLVGLLSGLLGCGVMLLNTPARQVSARAARPVWADLQP